MAGTIRLDSCSSSGSEDAIMGRYKRAGRYEREGWSANMVVNASVWPKWIADTDEFVYERQVRVESESLSDDSGNSSSEIATEYRLVNCIKKTNSPAFNHEALAQVLSLQVEQSIDPRNLPINELTTDGFPVSLAFTAFDRRWKYRVRENSLEELPIYPSHWLLSPDGKKAAYLLDHNLWLKDLVTELEYALTVDGERYNAYGVFPERADIVRNSGSAGYPQIPQAVWSPDSKYLLTQQTDERHVLSLPVITYVPQDGSIRPKLLETRYPFPGEQDVARFRLLVLQADGRKPVDVPYPSLLDVGVAPGLFSRGRAWWAKDCRTAYFVDVSRGEKQVTVVAFDVKSGRVKIIFEEKSETYIDLAFLNEDICSFIPLPDTNELIWWSERTGWAHLYLYDINRGVLKAALTKGEWLVREIIGVDLGRREVYFQAAGRVNGRDPYYCEIVRVHLDTKQLTVLASSDHNYLMHKPGTMFVEAMAMFGRDVIGCAGLAPSGNYFLTTRSRVNEISVTELRDRKGKLIMQVESADTGGLPNDWRWPEPVRLLAADGKTDIYGVVFFPTDFDKYKHYPIIDYVQVNTAASNVPKSAFCSDISSATAYFASAAWAELGFIVVIIDGRGSAQRDKIFHDESYGHTQMASNLEDHVAGIKQLANRYPSMDLERVGIVGPGGCNGPVYGLLAYPDFYKVGVANSIYDPRLTHGVDIYQGDPRENDYDQVVLGTYAANLKGKLLLVHGMLDNYYHSAGMLQLIDALAKANKNFDMLMLPNGGHMWRQGYPLRRAWDYMVQHLQEREPPLNYELKIGCELHS